MSEFVERAARAGFKRHHERKGLPASEAGWEATKNDWMEAAQAMMEAMREPTEAMLDAAWAEANDENAAGVWRDMIDEALK